MLKRDKMKLQIIFEDGELKTLTKVRWISVDITEG
jgi:hypothetical protein